MSDVIDFPGEYRTEHVRETDRWTTLALGAVMVAGSADNEERLIWLGAALEKFRDVADKQPDFNDVPRYAAFAVKLLLRALTDNDPRMSAAAELAGKAFWEKITAGTE